MEKEELKELISTMIKEAMNACVEEKKDAVTNETEPVQPTPAEAEATASDIKKEDKEEVKNEEVKEEVKKEEEKAPEKPEVIKIEALNSAPVTIGTSINGEEPWRKLHGKEFFDWIAKNK